MSVIPETLTLPISAEIIVELNSARTDPVAYSKKLSQEYSQFNGKISEIPAQGTSSAFQRETLEGVNSLKDAIKFLEQAKPLPALVHSLSLSRVSQDLCADQAASGKIGGITSKGHDLARRASEHGIWKGKLGENLIYGARNSFDVVAQCIIDDGNTSRSNRSKLFDPNYTTVGTYCAPHRQYGNVTSIVFSQDYTSASSLVSDNTRIITPRFTENGDAYTAESSAIVLVDCAYGEVERVYKKGSHFVVVKYKESGFEQKFRLPFAVPAKKISVKRAADDTIVFSVSKKDLEEVGECKSEDATTIVNNCKLQPNTSESSPSKPTIKFGPNAHDYIKISVESPKNGVTMSMKTKREDALTTSIIFEFNYEEADDANNTKKIVTSTQTIKIPFVVPAENFTTNESTDTLFVVVVELSKIKFDPNAEEEDIAF